jgi:hypothetical protein
MFDGTVQNFGSHRGAFGSSEENADELNVLLVYFFPTSS